MAADHPADVQGRDVARPVERKRKEQPIRTDRTQFDAASSDPKTYATPSNSAAASGSACAISGDRSASASARIATRTKNAPSLPGSNNSNNPAAYPNKPGFRIPCNATSSLYSRKHSTATAGDGHKERQLRRPERDVAEEGESGEAP